MTAAPDEPNRQAREAWDANARFWDERMGEGNDFVERLCWPALERLLGPRPGERILDVACGNGLTSRRLAAAGARVVAIDFSVPMIERARARTPAGSAVEYRVLDATDEGALLALGERAFEGALSNMALMDMAEVAPLFRALARLLRPESRFAFSVMHPAFNSPHARLYAEAEERGRDVVMHYGVRVDGYRSTEPARGFAIRGQPEAQFYFHRPLAALLAPAFDAGFVLDALEEPAFTEADRDDRRGPHWNNSTEIPPVLVARLRGPAGGR